MQPTETPRADDDCPADGCDEAPGRVEYRIIDGRAALVYWHDGPTSHCVEYPNGDTESFERDKTRTAAIRE